MAIADLLTLALKVSVFAIVLSLGLQARLADISHLLARPALLLKSALSMNVVMLGFSLGPPMFSRRSRRSRSRSSGFRWRRCRRY
jgi:BASS family bile acid:Na+ symporter